MWNRITSSILYTAIFAVLVFYVSIIECFSFTIKIVSISFYYVVYLLAIFNLWYIRK